jgi:hypothetical protein
VFLVWRELVSGTGPSVGDIYAAEYNGSAWIRLGANNGLVSDVVLGTDSNASAAVQPQLILSNFVSTDEMPVVAWNQLVRVGNGNAIYVKRWTGVAWVEMGTGSASRYLLPHTNTYDANAGVWVLGDFTPARGINADDSTYDRLYPLPVTAGGPGVFSEVGFEHFRSSSPILIKNNFGRPAVVFQNGAVRNNVTQYPYGIHVRSFTGNNAQPAYLAWEEVGRIEGGQNTGGYAAVDGEVSATWGENGTPDLYVAATLYPTSGSGSRLLRVLKPVGTSWATVGPDVASGRSSYSASLVKNAAGRLILAWHHGVGTQIYVAGTAVDANAVTFWAEIGAGSASGGGISADATASAWPDLAVDPSTNPESLVAAWMDGGGIPQIYLRTTRPVSVGTGAPAPPGGLTATSAGSTVSLSWSAPAGGGAPTGYVIEAGSAPGLADLANFPTGSVNSTFTAGGVPNGTFYVRVRATNASGTSAPSNEATLIVGPVPPGPPGSLAANATGSTVSLTWAHPTTGGTPTTYVIEAGGASGQANLANFATSSTATAFSASGVPSGTYYLRVRARNAAGTSAPSNEATLVVGTPLPVPGAPSGLRASVSGSTVTLSWTAPSSGGAPSSYILDAGTASGQSNLGSFPTSGAATQITVSGVSSGVYFVRVRAANASGPGGPSNEVTVTIGS